MRPNSNKPMRGNRGGRQGPPDEYHYFAHDDRVPRNHVKSYHRSAPRVSFKTQVRPPRDTPRSLSLVCLDDDIPMATSSNNNDTRQIVLRRRNRAMSRGRNSPLPKSRGFRGQFFNRLNPPPIRDQNWYKISIPFGNKYEKDYILNNLLSYMAPETFVPILYRTGSNDVSFFVDDEKTATALLQCDRKITATDGFKLMVNIFNSPIPKIKTDDKLKERLKLAMAKRYVQETNALDLSKFHLDPDLINDYICSLSRYAVLKVVLEIVAEHIPNLEALNLDGNKIHSTSELSVLGKKFPNLKILYIGDNKLKDIHMLDAFKDVKLEELKLTGNPICNKYKTRQNDYFSDIRKRFPRLLRLDGVELPRPIIFDLADDVTKMPPARRMCVANAKAQEIASQFLQQYFIIFDSENRQPLLDAYDEHACFSMTVSYSYNTSKLNGYILENRNLFRTNDPVKRQKLLKQGRLPVVSTISEMPQTSHYLNTFTMDISLVMERMMLVTVTGMFKEVDNKEEAIRYFNRTFIIVPQGAGYCIKNEQLHISHPTDAQLKQLNTPSSEAQMSEASGSKSASDAIPIAKPIPPQVPEDVKQQMTLTLSQQTNMNIEWSLKCLEDVQWNYDNALAAFQEYFKRGQIPAAAFNK